MAKYSLEVPLDASGVQDFKPDRALKVLVRAGEDIQSQEVTLTEKGRGSATFDFDRPPGRVRILVGPAEASDEELEGLQTLSVDVSTRLLDERAAKLPAILIPPYYWWWWLTWCRQYVIRGRVACADGSPVPGAKVCAFDVDWWFIWSSTQEVGCGYTDAQGAFEIRFSWCCGWWPWWWWRFRVWELNPELAERVGSVLRRVPDLRLAAAGNQPTLAIFDDLVAQEGVATHKALAPEQIPQLEDLRKNLLEPLPPAPELEQLRIWPWYPWHPWRDCAPDIIFRVTQDCEQPNTVIVDETIADTRWNVGTTLDVTLTANEKACCREGCPPGQVCVGGECLVITQVCGAAIDDVGGNLGAAAAPAGYLYPGAVTPGTKAYNGDRPFAGTISIEKNAGDMLNVDYYEIEHFDGVNWVALPAGAAQNFTRRYMEMVAPSFPTTNVPFTFSDISGHNVVESREHWEAASGLGIWGLNYIWLKNEFLVVPLDSTKFGDDEHRFRVVGWQISGGNLVNRRVLPICATQQENSLVLHFDNRVESALLHDPAHNCGGVHQCTTEPDTHISAVRINGQPVEPCGTVDAASGDLEVEFEVTDPDEHLAKYTLFALYGLNGSVNLLELAGATMTTLTPATQTGWSLGLDSGTYGVAQSQGAPAPHWRGGKYLLTVPASLAFPEPCCYQLRLRGWKRTVVSCNGGFSHRNTTELTLGVGVCPPPE